MVWRKREIIEMAREAGIDEWWDSGNEHREVLQKHLEAFAELVRADERDKWMERTAFLIRGERETCAKICDELANDENTDEYINGANWCSVRIRARGQA